MTRRPDPKYLPALAIACLTMGACTRSGQADLHLELTHPDLTTLREVLVNRFRDAQNHSVLRLTSARANPVEGALHLDLVVTTDGPCDDKTLAALRETTHELATAASKLAIHRAAPDQAKRLADHLRERFGRDVITPFDRPGLVIFALADNERPAIDDFTRAHPGHRVLTDPKQADQHWVVEVAALTSGDLASTLLATRDRVTVDLVMRDEAVPRLRALTESSRLAPLPITLDGELALTPTLASRVTEGRLRLELPIDALPLAKRLAAATLTTAPIIRDQRASCRPAE